MPRRNLLKYVTVGRFLSCHITRPKNHMAQIVMPILYMLLPLWHTVISLN